MKPALLILFYLESDSIAEVVHSMEKRAATLVFVRSLTHVPKAKLKARYISQGRDPWVTSHRDPQHRFKRALMV